MNKLSDMLFRYIERQTKQHADLRKYIEEPFLEQIKDDDEQIIGEDEISQGDQKLKDVMETQQVKEAEDKVENKVEVENKDKVENKVEDKSDDKEEIKEEGKEEQKEEEQIVEEEKEGDKKEEVVRPPPLPLNKEFVEKCMDDQAKDIIGSI
jgi:hypothetical protein